jgi:hypothetical protein
LRGKNPRNRRTLIQILLTAEKLENIRFVLVAASIVDPESSIDSKANYMVGMNGKEYSYLNLAGIPLT